MARKIMGLVPYDVGLGEYNHYAYAAGQKKPIAVQSCSEFNSNKEVQAWAKREYNKWLKKKKFRNQNEHISWAKKKMKKVM
jgi:hypothetical protein